MPLTTRNIAEESIITSDPCKGYYNINKFGFEHTTVSHSRNFVDPTFHTCTPPARGNAQTDDWR